MPESFAVMEGYLQHSQFLERPPFWPWNCRAENVGVSTDAHRDNDRENTPCALWISGAFSGGGLILQELGIVVNASAGWGVIFFSAEVVHANEDFNGHRGSTVCHSDGTQGDNWAKDSNGWQWMKTNSFQ
jgi:hypothetical protein